MSNSLMVVKQKPGFFTSTMSGRGITGTAMQRYNIYLIYANISARKCNVSMFFRKNCNSIERNSPYFPSPYYSFLAPAPLRYKAVIGSSPQDIHDITIR
jgi:hypothetical protein